MFRETPDYYYMEHPVKEAGRQLRKTERVYVCCCAEDLDAAGNIASTLQRMYQADVWISRGTEKEHEEGYLEAVLRNGFTMVLLVVSSSFLERKPAFDEVISTAESLRIRILPMTIEPGLSARFSEVFGHMQVLDFSMKGAEDRLKRYIDRFVDLYHVIDDGGPSIEELFSFRIFISYRKKNLLQLTDIMKTVRQWPEHLDTAIWYDDALVEGEDYDDQILEQLKASDTVLLIVTPDILEEDNYVLRCELPDALDNGKKVIAFLSEDTDREALEKYGELIGEIVDDPDTLRLLLKEAHDRAAAEDGTELTVENIYRLGLGYLSGTGTVRDPGMGEIALDIAARQGNGFASAGLGQILFERSDHERAAAYMENALDLFVGMRKEKGGLAGNEFSIAATTDKLMNSLLRYYINNIMYLEAWYMLHKVDVILMSPPNLQYGMVYLAAGDFRSAHVVFANIKKDIDNIERYAPGLRSLVNKCEYYACYGETIVCMMLNGQLDPSKVFGYGRSLLETAMDHIMEMGAAVSGAMDIDIVYRVDHYYFCMIGIAGDFGSEETVSQMLAREAEFLDLFGIREEVMSGRDSLPHFFPMDFKCDSIEELKRRLDAKTIWHEMFVAPDEPAELFTLQRDIEGVFGDIDDNAVISSYQCPFCKQRLYMMAFPEGNDPDLYLGRDRRYILSPASVFICPEGHMYATGKGHGLTEYPVFMSSPVVDKEGKPGRMLFDLWWKYFDSIADINAGRHE